MTDIIHKADYLAGGSRLRRIYEKLQIGGDKVYQQAGLKFKSSWFPVYYALSIAEKPQTIMQITSQIAFSHITVKNILKEMEKEGLVKVVPNPADRRSKLVSLSTRGGMLLKKLQPLWDSFSTVLRDLFNTGHPEMNAILARIDLALEEMPLNERMDQLGNNFTIRKARPSEHKEIGQLMVQVYSKLKGFPSKMEQPEYYTLLANIGELTKKPATELLVALSTKGEIAGAVVYFSNMKYYGSGGTATKEKNASGFRLLAVAPAFRGKGLGKTLSLACIKKARIDANKQLIIHTTKSMEIAWKMYEHLGFKRADELDFQQGELPVFGFRMRL